MKKMLLLLLFFILITSCTTNPYLKEKELPENIKYYSQDKQFNIIPDWYWRLRPSINPAENNEDVIGYKYLKDKKDDAIVIGEYNTSEKFFVVNWKNHGFFFIKEKDYLFANKFKKYLIPLNYKSNSIVDGYEQHLIIYYQDISTIPRGFFSQTVLSEAKSSGLNQKLILKLTLNRSLIKNKINSFTSKYSDVVGNQIQISYNTGYVNEFIKFTSCPLVDEFPNDALISHIECLIVKNIGSEQYKNQLGMLFEGTVFQTKSIVLKWGQNFYALPCE